MKLDNFFHPKSIVIVGASDVDGKVGSAVTKNILTLGYKGQVFFVNPKHEKISQRRCYKSISEIGASGIDLAIVIVPAKFVLEVVRNGMEKVKNFVIISAGFSETNEEGKQREAELLQLAQKNKLNILGPNCLGFIAPEIALNASFAGGMPDAGSVAFISQSGALAVAFMDIARKDGIAFSNVVSVGNKMQLDETALIEYFGRDKQTKVIGLYLEGIKDGERFIEVAEKVAKLKPLVILKAGKTEKAQKAISSHTGSLAGSDQIVSTVFKNMGIMRSHTVQEFFNFLKFSSEYRIPRNEKVAIITNAGGPGVLTTDAFQGKSIQMADLKKETKQKLKEFLPEESSVDNPVDLLGDADEVRYAKALDILDQENVGTIICVLTPQDQTPVQKIADTILAFKKKTNKLVTTVFMGGERVEGVVSVMQKSGIDNFNFPDEAVETLDSYYAWSRSRNQKKSFSKISPISARVTDARRIIDKARLEKRSMLFFREAKKLFQMYGINSIPSVEWSAKKSIKTSFPVVVKVDSDKVVHKTDQAALFLNIVDQKQLNNVTQKLQGVFPGENIIVQPMVSIDKELILGIKRDPIFGPVVVFGLGGIYTEVFKSVDFLVHTTNPDFIREAVLRSKSGFLFRSFRGKEPYNLDEFVSILRNVVLMAHELSEIQELDINPLLIYNKKKAVAVDIKVLI